MDDNTKYFSPKTAKNKTERQVRHWHCCILLRKIDKIYFHDQFHSCPDPHEHFVLLVYSKCITSLFVLFQFKMKIYLNFTNEKKKTKMFKIKHFSKRRDDFINETPVVHRSQVRTFYVINSYWTTICFNSISVRVFDTEKLWDDFRLALQVLSGDCQLSIFFSFAYVWAVAVPAADRCYYTNNCPEMCWLSVFMDSSDMCTQEKGNETDENINIACHQRQRALELFLSLLFAHVIL